MVTIKFLGNYIIMGKIQIISGLHIGGSQDRLEIGGIDSPVIRDPLTNYPYIPGSSLKGKLRMITELSEGKIGSDGKKGYVCDCGEISCPVCRIFGTAKDPSKIEIKNSLGPTRIIVRDSFPDKETIQMWENLDSDYLYTEAKTENCINRLTSEANPRTIERVIKGSFFNFYITLGMYEGKNESKELFNDENFDNKNIVLHSMMMLEDVGLGGSISRGYGRIKFLIKEPVFVSGEDYQKNSDNYKNTRYEILETIDRNSLKSVSEFFKQ